MFVLIVGKQQKYKSAVKVVISHYRCGSEVHGLVVRVLSSRSPVPGSNLGLGASPQCVLRGGRTHSNTV